MNFEKLKQQVPSKAAGLFTSLISKQKTQSKAPSVRLACDLGQTKIAFLEVSKIGEEVQVTRFLRIPRPSEGDDVLVLLKQALAEGGFQTNKIRVSVKGQGVVIRFIQFPMMTDEELRGAITFEAEKYIPFKSDEVIVDFQVLDKEVETSNGKAMNILLVAVKKDDLYPLIQKYQDAGFQIELIDSDATAFLNAIEFLHPEDAKNNIGVLDFGNEISTLGILKEGKPQFIRDIAFGNKDLQKRLKRKTDVALDDLLNKLSQKGAEDLSSLEKVLEESLQPLYADLKVSLDFYADQTQGAGPLQKIYVSGAIGSHPVVSQMLTKTFGFEFSLIDISSKVKMAESIKEDEMKQLSPILPIALGLCLRDL